MDVRTITGMTPEQAVEKMNAALDPRAYKAVGGGRDYLTDINGAYLTEVATQVFGLCGFGWWIEYDVADMKATAEEKKSQKGRDYTEWLVTISKLVLRYRLIVDGDERVAEGIPTGCGSSNEDLESALKGAVTSGIGKAFSQLCWQLDVYKGLRSHKTVGGAKAETKAEGAKAETKAEGAKAAKAQGSKPAAARVVDQSTGEIIPSGVAVGPRPWAPELVRKLANDKVVKMEKNGGYTASEKQIGLLRGVLATMFKSLGDKAPEYAHSWMAYIFGVESSKELSGSQVKVALDLIAPKEVDGKASPSTEAQAEAWTIVETRMRELGQYGLEKAA